MNLRNTYRKYKIYRELSRADMTRVAYTPHSYLGEIQDTYMLQNPDFSLIATCSHKCTDYEESTFFGDLFNTTDKCKYNLTIKNNGGLRNAPDGALVDDGWLARTVYNMLCKRGSK